MNLELLRDAPLVVLVHMVFGFLALGLGVFIMLNRKGTPKHKISGRLFVTMMIIVAASAVFIRQINDGRFSLIHLFVPLTFWGAWNTVSLIRKGDLARHKKAVRGLFFGALLIPSILSFMPGRLIWAVLFP